MEARELDATFDVQGLGSSLVRWRANERDAGPSGLSKDRKMRQATICGFAAWILIDF
jgi:hypothetical protein